ncbi:MAG: hypothetical protein E4H14_09575 [Candidatus Thorarchaeota archaeon]|nr:MAG: hypothetical protein E4H14_09575 [Candidatus Thorarchaeota archaeon]
MSFKPNEYYYNAQVRSYVLQFMAIFAGMQVMVGKWASGNTVTQSTPVCGDPNATTEVEEVLENRLISVPIHYGHQDRIVAAILTDNTQTKPIRLPVMSAVVKDFKLSQERLHGVGFERRQAYVEVGGLVPDDIKVVHQRMPVPYDLTMELAIYVSNTDQHFQLLEQIGVLFDPSMTIQRSDAPFDQTRLTQVTLDDIQMDINYPIGTDRRIIQSSLTFTVPIWLSIPAEVRKDYVAKIFARIGIVSTASQNSYEIVAELDRQGIEYELLFDADDLPFV